MLQEYQHKIKNITIDTKSAKLAGLLEIPKDSKRLVIFVHGSGSSRLSSRNQYVASVLSERNIATLLFDLLTAEEEKVDLITREYRFDIPLLANRLVEVTHWILAQKEFNFFNIGYFGSSTGAAAALIAASQKPETIKAVVSRGGRPDLARQALKNVRAATLFIIGGLDYQVIELNEIAKAQMPIEPKIEIIAGATHLFEEPGKLEIVSDIAANWFEQNLR